MTAAAQCPTCAHHFELRDGQGNLFPLAYCSSCQSYYRESLGECRWCHTKPERPPIGPNVWRGIGAVALIALVITARLLQDDGSIEPAIKHAKIAAKVQSPPPPLAEDTALATKVTMRDTAVVAAPTIATADTVVPDSVNRAPPTEVARMAAAPDVTPVSPPRASVQTAPVAPPKASLPSATKAASVTASQSRRTTRWVSSISRDWVPVRAGASKRSRLIASIGPNSRVQLGESRDGWRRIRAKGVAGWVEQHVEFRVATR